MQTLLLYLLIMALVAGAVFAIVWFVFGRGEDLPPVETDTTLTRLPTVGISGEDVRALRFMQTFRGYKQSEVDWALARLAREVDPQKMWSLTKTITLDEVIPAAADLLEGRVRGRIVVKIA